VAHEAPPALVEYEPARCAASPARPAHQRVLARLPGLLFRLVCLQPRLQAPAAPLRPTSPLRAARTRLSRHHRCHGPRRSQVTPWAEPSQLAWLPRSQGAALGGISMPWRSREASPDRAPAAADSSSRSVSGSGGPSSPDGLWRCSRWPCPAHGAPFAAGLANVAPSGTSFASPARPGGSGGSRGLWLPSSVAETWAGSCTRRAIG
jgi:hypothetical protein